METLKIMVVDDEPGIRSGVFRILNGFKVSFPFLDDDIIYEVSEASTAEEALEKLQQELPEVILLDNKLPGMQGLELLEKIKQREWDVIVIMITSYASLEVAVKATKDGAYDFIPKPFTPQELRASLENITKQVFLRKVTKKMNTQGKEVRFQFLSVLSHELKTPINVIEGYLKIMKERQMGHDLDAYEEMLTRSLDRINAMRSLIYDLLDLTRVEGKSKDRRISDINFKKVVATSIDTLTPLAIQKEIKVNTEIPENLIFPAVEEEIEIVFNNLISNAIKYNKNNGTVHIQVTSEGNKIIIKVKDTGIGIPEGSKEDLFREFYRVKSTHTKHISGSGLGLSIVKKIVNLYNGEITVESWPEKGSLFTITLPINQ